MTQKGAIIDKDVVSTFRKLKLGKFVETFWIDWWLVTAGLRPCVLLDFYCPSTRTLEAQLQALHKRYIDCDVQVGGLHTSGISQVKIQSPSLLSRMFVLALHRTQECREPDALFICDRDNLSTLVDQLLDNHFEAVHFVDIAQSLGRPRLCRPQDRTHLVDELMSLFSELKSKLSSRDHNDCSQMSLHVLDANKRSIIRLATVTGILLGYPVVYTYGTQVFHERDENCLSNTPLRLFSFSLEYDQNTAVEPHTEYESFASSSPRCKQSCEVFRFSVPQCLLASWTVEGAGNQVEMLPKSEQAYANDTIQALQERVERQSKRHRVSAFMLYGKPTVEMSVFSQIRVPV